MATRETNLTREQAFDLLSTYNQDPFHIQHAQTVEGVMRYFAAEYDPDNVEFWGQVGLLHDLDFERWPEEHCVKEQELMRQAGVSEEAIRSAACHGWGMTGVQYAPEHVMEKVLFACDELTGLIGAAVLMRPSKSVMDFELKSLKKKFKDKRFAAGCSRDTIVQGAQMLGWSLDDLMQRTIDAMRSFAPDRDTFQAAGQEQA